MSYGVGGMRLARFEAFPYGRGGAKIAATLLLFMAPADSVSTHEAPDLRLFFSWALLVGGFGYVAVFLCGRATPFESGDNRWNDWLGVALSGPAVFFLATRHTLAPFSAGARRAVWWNGCRFGLPFFAGLHWEYLGSTTGANFSLTARQLAHLNAPSRIALAIGIGIALAVTALCLREARKAGILGRYLGAFGSLLGALSLTTFALGPRYYVHIHHYFWSLCLLPFLRFRHPVCVVMQGLLTGVFVEGAARYGLSPIWILRQ